MSPSVTLFTTKTCAYCKVIKEWMSRKNIQFKEVDLSSEPERYKDIFDLTGLRIVPVVLIENGDKRSVITGLNLSGIASALAL